MQIKSEYLNDGFVSDDLYLSLLKRRIKVAREAKGLTQKEVADMIDMKPEDFQRFESKTGKKPFNPTILTLRKIALALDLDTGELTREIGDVEACE